jgi:hypothetical protein
MNEAMAGSDKAIPMKDWMQHSTLNFFGRNPNAVMARQTVALAREPISKILRRSFEVISRDAHYITINSRLILADRVSGKIYQEEEVFKAETAINAQLERINDYFDKRIQQAEAKLRAAGYDPNAVERKPITYEARCSTRTATEYLQLLTKADIYLVLHEFLWITGELSDSPQEALRARLNNEREVRNHLHSVSRTTTNHFNIIRRICNGVLDQRREQRTKQSERDRSRAAEAKAKALQLAQKDMDKLAPAEPAAAAAPKVFAIG